MPKKDKREAEQKIEKFFSDIKEKNSSDVKKIKRLAMHYNIKLRSLRKKFCKKCLSPFTAKNAITRIKNKTKVVKCANCGTINRWKIKSTTNK